LKKGGDLFRSLFYFKFVKTFDFGLFGHLFTFALLELSFGMDIAYLQAIGIGLNLEKFYWFK